MIFPKDFEKKIGFDNLRTLLIEKCETVPGKMLAERMEFEKDFNKVEKNLNEVVEMNSIIQEGKLPEDTIYDIFSWLREIKGDGSFLSSEKLLKLSKTLSTMENIYKFFHSPELEEKAQYKFLKNTFADIPFFPQIVIEINSKIDITGEVKDNASTELFEIRKSIKSSEGSIQKAMQKVMAFAIKEGIVDNDTTPGFREGRMVIPVNSMNKKSINGIIHDVSASGKTVFIEPAEVVEAGNNLRRLKNEEQREIVNILIGITSEIRSEISEIMRGAKLLAQYDFIKAKARFAIETEGQMPILEKSPEIDWFHAVHPGLLLKLRKEGKTAVPLNIKLDEKQRILIISGPNAGGKSVCLKTVATVQYMMQCGLLPSLYYNSHMGIYKNIFIDIGDEQSIENDLSTYSSHLANMKFFLNNADNLTLILADEMGSGTEPQIGGALAQAILEYLGKKGCFGVVTTHYQNLKTFAEHEEGFINGAMLYDRQKLEPTFKLDIGHPGSSFALDIAAKTGLPKEVVNNAKNIVGSEYIDLDKYILDIQRDKKYWQNKRLNIKEKEHKLDKILEEYEKSSSELKKQRAEIIKKARNEAKEILGSANAMIERSIHEIRKAEAEKAKTRQIRKELEQYKADVENSDKREEKDILDSLHLKKIKNRKPAQQKTKINKEEIKSLKTGDYVKMSEGGVVGKILSIEGERAEVAFGLLRSKIELKKLVSAKKPKESVKQGIIYSSQDDGSRERQLNFKTELDIRGMRADEALQAVTYFLDDAVQFNASRLRILHGTGHGILKTLIRQQLKANPNVLHFEDEDIRLGGAGITVVDL